ncbi:MAG: OmpA family protein [Pirellulales bacterium]|nr:OmpA family protein [Pirellulales bacterium]
MPKTQVNEAQAENRVYADQNKAQLVEIDHLKAHLREQEVKLARSEEELAIVQQQADLDRAQLSKYDRAHSDLVEQYRLLARDAKMPPSLGKQMQELSRRHPALRYDPETGMSKLDTDILFDDGDAELKPAAQRMLADFARALRSPEAEGLKIMVVGHTDSQGVGEKPAREKDGGNFQISAARALAVADRLKKEGIGEQRIGVAGLGASQPIASNASPRERLKNRRVEIFVVAPETPVVGWTDSTPSVYRR